MDIGYVFSQILDCTDEGMFGCNFMNMEYVSEFRRGYTIQNFYLNARCAIFNKITLQNFMKIFKINGQ